MTQLASRPRLLILSFSHLAMDSRVLRQVQWLSRRYEVTSAAFGPSPVEGVEHIELLNAPPYRGGPIARVRYVLSFILGRFRGLTARNLRDLSAMKALEGREWDVIVANDVDSLPLATRLPARWGVLADLHEYAPRQADESLVFRLTSARYFTWVLNRFLPNVARVTTVSKGIADEYSRKFGVTPVVVANAAPFRDSAPGQVGSPIRIVHSASAAPARRLEVMIEAVRDTTANVTLDLYLVNNESAYARGLRALAAQTDRVTIHDAVPNAELIELLARYDIGVHLLPPINFNHLWALPNKLFDYVQARLAVVIGPSPEMANVVNAYGIGAVTRDFSAGSLAQLLDSLNSERVAEWKRQSNIAARKLSGESQLETFENVIQEMLEQPERAG